ncbi:MAG TPA: aminotransferase class IV [Thermoanaerobaculia bacterium]|nr:aminotransferase class IV [Thermoanaerobaculia bacterium]
MSLTYWNGRLLPEAEVAVSPADAGFLFGDGLFETLRADDGTALDVEAHLDRLLAGLARIGLSLPEDRAALAGALAAVAAQAHRPTARLRLTVTRGTSVPTRLIAAAPYEPPSEEMYRTGVRARLLRVPAVLSQGPLAGLKSLSYQANRLALREAEAAGAWEVLLLNEHGRLAEGSRTNVALVLDGRIFTPPESEGCLPGTVRRRLLERGALQERTLTVDDLARAEGVLLMNSLIGALPVGWMDDRPLAAPVSGETAAGLRALLEG